MRSERAVWVGLVTALTLTSGAQAQIGDGWIEEFPRLCLHHAADGTLYNVCPAPGYFDDGLCHYDNDGVGLETFYLYSHRSNRIEIRAHNDYQAGMKQFEGWVWIEPPTNNESIMQIFGSPGPNATTAMFRAFNTNGGEIRYYSSPSQTIASGIYGTWTQVNIIHDADGGWVYAYINGSLAGQWPDRGVAPHYFKYGAYGTHNDATPAYVWWYGVHFFRQ